MAIPVISGGIEPPTPGAPELIHVTSEQAQRCQHNALHLERSRHGLVRPVPVFFHPRVLLMLGVTQYLMRFVGLKSDTSHCIGRRAIIQIGLDALPQGMQLFA